MLPAMGMIHFNYQEAAKNLIENLPAGPATAGGEPVRTVKGWPPKRTSG